MFLWLVSSLEEKNIFCFRLNREEAYCLYSFFIYIFIHMLFCIHIYIYVLYCIYFIFYSYSDHTHATGLQTTKTYLIINTHRKSLNRKSLALCQCVQYGSIPGNRNRVHQLWQPCLLFLTAITSLVYCPLAFPPGQCGTVWVYT